MSSNRSVAPSEHFAKKALLQFPDGFAPIYSDLADQARRAFPWETEDHVALGLQLHKVTQAWPDRKVIIIADALLRENGTVELVDYEVVPWEDSPADLGL